MLCVLHAVTAKPQRLKYALLHILCRFHPIRVLLNNIRWSLMDNKFKGEEALRSSGLSYTIVKPGGLTNAPGGTVQLRAGARGTVRLCLVRYAL